MYTEHRIYLMGEIKQMETNSSQRCSLSGHINDSVILHCNGKKKNKTTEQNKTEQNKTKQNTLQVSNRS